tara:strand:+ start:1388 stop:3388 length:2001 start_codon:yes stop_codon:yes gene_type:complete
MPRKKSFKYEAIEGKPWPYENLISDMEFSIQKSTEKIEKEKQQVRKQKTFLFYLDETRRLEGEKKLNYELEKFKNSKIQNKSNLKSRNEFNTYLNKLERKINSLWNKIYEKGVIQNNGNIDGKDGNYVILVDKGEGLDAYYLNSFLTISQASELIKGINLSTSEDYNEIVNMMTEALIQNILFDSKATEINLSSELDKVSNVNGKVDVGELIVSKGELISSKTYLKLISYKAEFEGGQITDRANKFIFLGQVIIISLCFLILFLFIKMNRKKLFNDLNALKFLLLNILLFFIFARFTQIFSNNNLIYIVPYCALPLVIRSFYDLRLALFVHIISMFLVGWLAPVPFHFVFIQFMAGVLSILSIKNLYKRSDLFTSVGKIALVYITTFMGLSLITKGDIFGHDLIIYGFLFVSAFLTLFTYPLVYIYEKLFSLVSDITLLELADTNHPLLKEMAEKAPGTFQHSLQVSSLAEKAIMEIGGNVLLVRTGAMYHDIGKVEKPLFFIENQMAGINPHDELSADESAKLIISHVIGGIEKAKKNKLPEQIIDFIRTHHGEGMVQYFYKAYVKKFPDKMNNVKAFRYPGPKPFSKETAVVMMADSVEAASRSLTEKNSENICILVEKIVKNQMDEGQFDNASITLKEINTIKKVFIKKLLNINHLRIEYPSS